MKKLLLPVDYGLQVARFCYLYPAMPYASPVWPTRDHIIPWTLFQVLYRRMYSVLAFQRVNATRAAGETALLGSGQIPDKTLDEAFMPAERE